MLFQEPSIFPLLRHYFVKSRSHLPFPAVFSVGFAWFLLPPIWCLLFFLLLLQNVCIYAKSLQSCPTLCHPMDCSPSDSSVHGILQARILEWAGIPFSGDLPDSGIKHRSPALQADSLPLSYQGSPKVPAKYKFVLLFIYTYRGIFTTLEYYFKYHQFLAFLQDTDHYYSPFLYLVAYLQMSQFFIFDLIKSSSFLHKQKQTSKYSTGWKARTKSGCWFNVKLSPSLKSWPGGI